MKHRQISILILLMLLRISGGLGQGSIPPARYGHNMVFNSGEIYLFGGTDRFDAAQKPATNLHKPMEQLFNDIWAWNNAEAEWLEIPQVSTPPPRHSASTVALYNERFSFLVLWGEGENQTHCGDIWEYVPETQTWNLYPACQSAGQKPAPRKNHASVEVGGRIYVLMGEDNENPLDDIWYYDPVTDTWAQGDTYPGACAGHGAFMYNDDIYVFGGNDQSSYRNDMWRYSISEDMWHLVDVQGDVPDERAYFASATDGQRLWIIGGKGQLCVYQDFWEFNAETSAWRRLKDFPSSQGLWYFPGVSNLTFGIHSPGKACNETTDALYIFGGMDADSAATSDFYKYVPDDSIWFKYNPESAQWEPAEPTSVRSQKSQLEGFMLFQNYPNPFNNQTTIAYTVKEAGHVRIQLVNLQGVTVRTLTNRFCTVGSYRIQLDASGLSSGVYFYILQSGNNLKETKKMLLMR